jgi:hypothetical protein
VTRLDALDEVEERCQPASRVLQPGRAVVEPGDSSIEDFRPTSKATSTPRAARRSRKDLVRWQKVEYLPADVVHQSCGYQRAVTSPRVALDAHQGGASSRWQ